MKKNSLLFLVFLSLPLYTWADKTLDSLLNVLTGRFKSMRHTLPNVSCVSDILSYW